MTSFVLGIGMTVTAAYIFLAILLAPALISTGMNPIAVHMFIFYWGMLSFITPPVALGAFAAASVAKSSPMKTGFEAMRLGSVIYFIPFFFVLDPALVLVGTPQQIFISLTLAVIGIFIFSSTMQGYLAGVGKLNIFDRLILFVGSLLLPLPGYSIFPVSKITLLTISACLIIPILCLAYIKNRTKNNQDQVALGSQSPKC